MLYRNRIRIARGVAWAVLMLAALVLQATVCNRLPIFGVAPVLLPVATICVAMMLSAEAGAVVGLIGGMLACLGGDAYSMTIPLLALAGALAGGLCTLYFTRTLLPALLLSAIALLLCQLPTWALLLYLQRIPASSFITVVLPEFGYSLLYTLPFYWISWRISLIKSS